MSPYFWEDPLSLVSFRARFCGLLKRSPFLGGTNPLHGRLVIPHFVSCDALVSWHPLDGQSIALLVCLFCYLNHFDGQIPSRAWWVLSPLPENLWRPCSPYRLDASNWRPPNFRVEGLLFLSGVKADTLQVGSKAAILGRTRSLAWRPSSCLWIGSHSYRHSPPVGVCV